MIRCEFILLLPYYEMEKISIYSSHVDYVSDIQVNTSISSFQLHECKFFICHKTNQLHEVNIVQLRDAETAKLWAHYSNPSQTFNDAVPEYRQSFEKLPEDEGFRLLYNLLNVLLYIHMHVADKIRELQNMYSNQNPT